MNREKRICTECEMPLYGRTDKKFCNNHCRNAWNNKRNSDSNNFMRNVNNILRKNRRILFEFIEKEKTKIPKKDLILKGFNFDYFTNLHELDTGEKKYLVYEAGVINRLDEKVEVFKLQAS